MVTRPLLPSKRKKSIPFHIQLTYLFTGLMTFFALVIGSLQFTEMSRVMLTDANARYALIGQEASARIVNLYEPAKVQVENFALQAINENDHLEQRLRYVRYMGNAIISTKAALSLYIGYGNGEFFSVRRSKESEFNRSHEGQYQHAFWEAQCICFEQGKPVIHLVYFDQQFKELGRTNAPYNQYDPRQRLWYKNALSNQSDDAIVSEPYYFFSRHQLGVTYSQRITDSNAVVGMDIALSTIESVLQSQKSTDSTVIALVNQNAEIIAMQKGSEVQSHLTFSTGADGGLDLPQLHPSKTPILHAIFHAKPIPNQSTSTIKLDGHKWETFKNEVKIPGGDALTLLIASPHDELLKDVIAIRIKTAIIFAIMLAIGLAIAIYFSRFASRPIKALNIEAKKIAQFDFSHASQVSSHITEIHDLSESMTNMKETIRSFIELSTNLASETNFDTLLAKVLEEISAITSAQAGVLYLYQPQRQELRPAQTFGITLPITDLPSISFQEASHPLVIACRTTTQITAAESIDITRLFGDIGTIQSIKNVLAISLKDRNGNLAGAITLLIPKEVSIGQCAMAEAVSGSAAVAIEAKRLNQEQKALLEAFIQLLAGAIDAKSPYTGGHCQRVPTLTKMLAQAACEQTEGEFAQFTLNESEWEQLHIAAWLHDCGKVTTPEYIVDKATKLETLYDRIHEIRMRFELLKRDAEIQYWKSLHAGGNEATLHADLNKALMELDQEFVFIARCNEGGEFLSADDQARIRQIAQRTWQRTLSDRVGLSHEELERKSATPEPSLPTTENLLADKPEHVIHRGAHDQIAADNPWGFKVNVPEHLYNRGEIYNLTLGRGTLSAEERYKINEHMIQTIKMLDKLPFPRHLSQVPEIAGGHHEKMDGTGYPKRLQKHEMSIPARMMAIADIFEALTAVDRPYKRGKTLSESLKIMHFMVKDQHIDADLFALFLKSGVYLQYAKQFLRAEQIDEVDISKYL